MIIMMLSLKNVKGLKTKFNISIIFNVFSKKIRTI